MPSDKLFERFNRNFNIKDSTGLGLAIVKAIADASGLSITYSTTEDISLKSDLPCSGSAITLHPSREIPDSFQILSKIIPDSYHFFG